MDLINLEALQGLVAQMVDNRLEGEEKSTGPEYLTTTAAAEYLGVSRSTFWRLRKEYPIDAYFFEVSYPRFKRSDLEEWAKHFKEE